jgi:hypothetical protein
MTVQRWLQILAVKSKRIFKTRCAKCGDKVNLKFLDDPTKKQVQQITDNKYVCGDCADKKTKARKSKSQAATKDNYPVKLTLELTKWENLSSLIEFWRRVRDSANGGHSFSIEADRDDLGDKAPKVFVDGDGNDKIGAILLNGKDVTKG